MTAATETTAATATADVPAVPHPAFASQAPRVGVLTLEPVDPARDAATVHAWLAHPASVFWRMGHLGAAEVRDYLTVVVADAHQDAWLGCVDGAPTFYVETYDPAHGPLAGVHEPVPGDLGMHLLVAPPPLDRAHRTRGLTDAVMRAVVEFCLAPRPAGRGAARVVVEPDVANRAVAAKNAAAGFRVLRHVDVTDGGHTKRAALSVCTREDFAASPLGPGVDAAPHLRPDLAEAAHRHLAAKVLGELAHERLFRPTPDRCERAIGPVPGPEQGRSPAHNDQGWGGGAGGASRPTGYALALDGVTYRFAARTFALEHWVVDPASITRTAGRAELPVDVLELVVELQPLLSIPDDLVATYLEELSATLAAACAKRERELAGGSPQVPALVATLAPAPAAHDTDDEADDEADDDARRRADAFQETEAAMTEGHPGFVANNGRIGFSLDDYRAYAPERGQRLRLMWLAARREHTHLALAADQSERRLYDAELSGAERAAFGDRLAARGLDRADYLYLPVHPWQWQHRVPITFAADVARDDLVPLGPGADEYQPQQSIRTLFNRTRPGRHYVKTALAIQNMGFLRGLSPAYMRATPAINDWVADVVDSDPTLGAAGFRILREVASVGYTGDVYHRTARPSAHRKMLAALWRESPLPRTGPGERLVTMAALLHRDAAGTALVTSLVRASGVEPQRWLQAYLDAYLYPVVHCLLAHRLAFMPHGENLVLVLRDGVVRRALMKDVGEEVSVLSGGAGLPPQVARIGTTVDDDEQALAVFTDVFDGVLRHLAGILAVDGVLAEDRFWATVRATLDRHRDEHPGVGAGVDLRAPRFAHSCLNRLQLRNTLQMVDLADQSASLLYAGSMANPVADGAWS